MPRIENRDSGMGCCWEVLTLGAEKMWWQPQEVLYFGWAEETSRGW